MRLSITAAKVVSIGIGLYLLLSSHRAAFEIGLICGAIGLIACVSAFLLNQSRLYATLVGISILAIVCALLIVQISRFEDPADAPEQWFSLTGAARPIYNQSLLAELEIRSNISPGIYVANGTIQGQAWKKRRQWWFAEANPPIREKQFPVLLLLKGTEYFPGCRIQARVYGRGVPEHLTDSSFHKYARRQGATSLLRLSPRYHILSTTCPEPDLRIRIKRRIAAVLSSRLTGRELDSAMGFILGQAGYMDRDLKQRATELGILHVFAASGMHLAILYGLLLIPMAFLLGRKHPVAVCAPLPLCIAYCWLLGFPVSLSRALVFVSLYALSCVLNRRLTSKETILNSAIILMVWMPREFATLSSALSFAAVAGILYFSAPAISIVSVRIKLLSFLWKQSVVTICATICTAPILVLALGNHSFMGPLINLLLVPLTDLVLPLLFLATTLDLFGFGVIASIVWIPARGLTSAFVGITESIAPLSLFYKYDSPIALPVCTAVLLLCLLVWVRHSPEFCGRMFRFARAATVLLACVIGPPGALLSKAFLPFAPGFAGQASDRFEKERKRMGEDLLSIISRSPDDDSHGESDGS
ncbi:MAG: ComEC/Rec2 family competence protein [Leptospirales bacterium]|nr:ComEC/Rec2 family competence protein [Leptospirales bacterium]